MIKALLLRQDEDIFRPLNDNDKEIIKKVLSYRCREYKWQIRK